VTAYLIITIRECAHDSRLISC